MVTIATEVITRQVSQEQRQQIPAAEYFITALETHFYISDIVFKANIRNTY